MKRYSVAIFFMLVLAMADPASSVKINSYSITSEIMDGGTISQKITITIQNDEGIELKSGTMSVSPGSKIVSISDNYGNLRYDFGNTPSSIVFEFSTPIESGNKRLVIITLETDSLVKNKGNYMEYLFVFTPKQNVSGFEHILKLPEGAELYSPEQFSIIFPEGNISKINGLGTITWNNDLTAGQPEVFLARYKLEKTDWTQLSFYIAAAAAIACIIFAGQRLAKKYKERKKTTSILQSINLLNENEKTMVESIIKNPGIKQNDLLEMLNYRKSALSKIISRLEARRIIERKKYGKINRIYPGERIKHP